MPFNYIDKKITLVNYKIVKHILIPTFVFGIIMIIWTVLGHVSARNELFFSLASFGSVFYFIIVLKIFGVELYIDENQIEIKQKCKEKELESEKFLKNDIEKIVFFKNTKKGSYFSIFFLNGRVENYQFMSNSREEFQTECLKYNYKVEIVEPPKVDFKLKNKGINMLYIFLRKGILVFSVFLMILIVFIFLNTFINPPQEPIPEELQWIFNDLNINL